MIGQLATCLKSRSAVQQAHKAGLLALLTQAVAEPHADWSDRSALTVRACHHQISIAYHILHNCCGCHACCHSERFVVHIHCTVWQGPEEVDQSHPWSQCSSANAESMMHIFSCGVGGGRCHPLFLWLACGSPLLPDTLSARAFKSLQSLYTTRPPPPAPPHVQEHQQHTICLPFGAAFDKHRIQWLCPTC